MREILFRGKKETDGMWLYGGLHNNQPERPLIEPHTNLIENGGTRFIEYVHPETVGQYTGLTDRKGAKIFEGDIVIFNFPYNPKAKSKRKIIFEQGAFQAIFSGGYVSLSRNFPFLNSETLDAEIIGNIYDNPELLED
jgi:uncharacterized phage protein (TIGR01671 family)